MMAKQIISFGLKLIRYLLYTIIVVFVMGYCLNFVVGLMGAAGLLSYYTPLSLGLEIRRLGIEYSALLLFPLYFLGGKLPKKIWSLKLLAAPISGLIVISAVCLALGGISFTPYLTFSWDNIAVLSWSIFFIIVYYCYTKFTSFSGLQSFVSTCASLIVASWLYELFDYRMLSRFPDYFVLTQSWAVALILLFLVFKAAHVKLHFSRMFVVGIFVFALSQVPYFVYNASVVGWAAVPFWQVWDNLIRLTTIPLFVSLPLMVGGLHEKK